MALKTVNMNFSWRFIKGESEEAIKNNFNDSAWRLIDLPHDWSIEENFSPDALGYCRAAYLPNGKGTYRKRFKIPTQYKGCKVARSQVTL